MKAVPTQIHILPVSPVPESPDSSNRIASCRHISPADSDRS